jgi:hypothetical protein
MWQHSGSAIPDTLVVRTVRATVSNFTQPISQETVHVSLVFIPLLMPPARLSSSRSAAIRTQKPPCSLECHGLVHHVGREVVLDSLSCFGGGMS